MGLSLMRWSATLICWRYWNFTINASSLSTAAVFVTSMGFKCCAVNKKTENWVGVDWLGDSLSDTLPNYKWQLQWQYDVVVCSSAVSYQFLAAEVASRDVCVWCWLTDAFLCIFAVFYDGACAVFCIVHWRLQRPTCMRDHYIVARSSSKVKW